MKIPSYRVTEGDVIGMTDTMKANALVLEAVDSAEREVPEYMEVDTEEDFRLANEHWPRLYGDHAD